MGLKRFRLVQLLLVVVGFISLCLLVLAVSAGVTQEKTKDRTVALDDFRLDLDVSGFAFAPAKAGETSPWVEGTKLNSPIVVRVVVAGCQVVLERVVNEKAVGDTRDGRQIELYRIAGVDRLGIDFKLSSDRVVPAPADVEKFLRDNASQVQFCLAKPAKSGS